MRIFLEENWIRWEEKDFYSLSAIKPSLDQKKDNFYEGREMEYDKTKIDKTATWLEQKDIGLLLQEFEPINDF